MCPLKVSQKKVCFTYVNAFELPAIQSDLFFLQQTIGQFCYAGTDMLNSWHSHLNKQDRKSFNKLPTGDEFGRGSVAHVFSHGDCRAARYEPLDCLNTHGHEGIVRFRVPVTPRASFHIINGPIQAIMSQAKFIKYFDCYRPMSCPELWWFEIM